MLENLDAEYLGTLQHAYGYATDVPGLLNDIRSDSKEVRDNVYYELFGNIYHQGTVYEATVYVLPFLIEIFCDPSTTDENGKGELASLIAAIAGGHGYYEVHQHWIDKKSLEKMIGDETDLKNELEKENRITQQIRTIANPIIPLLIPYLKHEEYGVRDSIAESIPYYPDHYSVSLPALEKACAVEPEEMSKEIMETSIAVIKGCPPDETVVRKQGTQPSTPPTVRIAEGDLLDQKVDVIVNAWNRNIIPWWLLLPQGVSRAIKRQGGYEPFRELAKHGPIPLGGAVHTTAGKLPFKGIIHVAGINMLWFATETSIRKSVRTALRLATEKNYRSIAFPLIGAGTGGASQQKTLDMIREEIQRSDFDGEAVVVKFKSNR